MLPSSRSSRVPEYRARPQLEVLEDRTVPTITYHGGNLLTNVQVQGLYLGTDWYNNSNYYSQTGYLESYLYSLVNSSYMDALYKAGYYVGRGGTSSGRILLNSLNSGFYLDDSTIRSTLQSYINSSSSGVQQPNSQRLYVIYVEDNIVVRNGTADSRNNFLGYHGAFAGQDRFGNFADIRYAVIPYHGTNGNAQIPWLGTLDSLTEVTSHEITEAVTDPDVNYRQLGWYDDSLNGENGDVMNGSTVFMTNGYFNYAVQRIPDLNDQAMTPQGAIPQVRASFVLQPNGFLWEHTAYGWTFLSSGVAKISDQAIDNHGRAFIDVISTAGNAYEYHDGPQGWVYLWYGAYDAKAGQSGNSYVLFNDSSLFEYSDYHRSWYSLGSYISTIDSGTDARGVSTVDVIYFGNGWQWSDSSGWSHLADGVAQISAGQQGIVGVVSYAGQAFILNEYTGQWSYLVSGVAALNVGTDYYGGYTISVISYGGQWWDYDQYGGWAYHASGLSWLSKAHNGTSGVVGYGGYGYDNLLGGWSFLSGYLYAVV